MIALLLSALFLFAAVVAAGTLVRGLRGIVAESGQARAALLACPTTVTATYRISEVKALRTPAQILELPVRQAVARLVQPELRAAA